MKTIELTRAEIEFLLFLIQTSGALWTDEQDSLHDGLVAKLERGLD